MKDPYHGDQSIHPMFFVICCALVNYEITLCNHPFRDENQYYIRQLTQMTTNAENKSKKKAKQRNAYMERRLREKMQPEDSDSF